MRMLIKNGRVIDPASNTDDIRDILVEDGVIACLLYTSPSPRDS